MPLTLTLRRPSWLIAVSSAFEDEADDAGEGASRNNGSASTHTARLTVEIRMGRLLFDKPRFSTARPGGAIGPRCSCPCPSGGEGVRVDRLRQASTSTS